MIFFEVYYTKSALFFCDLDGSEQVKAFLMYITGFPGRSKSHRKTIGSIKENSVA